MTALLKPLFSDESIHLYNRPITLSKEGTKNENDNLYG